MFKKGLPAGYRINLRKDSAGSLRGEIYYNDNFVTEAYSLLNFWIITARRAKRLAWKHYKSQKIAGNV